MLRFIIVCCFTLTFSQPALAQKVNSESGKFVIDGATLGYDSNNAQAGEWNEIENADVDVLTRILEEYPDLKLLELTSTGGSVWAGEQMARMIMDYRLNTRVIGECSSACVTIFLAGEQRDMERGSMIGFHQNSWSESGLRSYYKYWREEESWENPFEFGSWVYRDTQTEMYNQLNYLLARGVDPEFAIETKRERSSMWFPSRSALEQAGVLRD